MNTQHRTKDQRKKAGLVFIVSLVAIILLLIFEPEFFWLALPFLLTSAVVALDVI